MGIKIKSWGHYIPDNRITNRELAERFNIPEEWIYERVGIEERAWMQNGSTSDMAVYAAQNCLANAGVSAGDIDCIIVGTITPDHRCPSTASQVHAQLGTVNAWAFDISAACSGFLYALNLAECLIETRKYRNVLVIGADKMTSIIDYEDRKTCLLLGDAGGACLLGYTDEDSQFLNINCKLDSTNWKDVMVPDGGSRNPDGSDKYLRFLSKENFKNGKNLFVKSIKEALNRTSLSMENVSYIVPHQSNKRMLEAIADDMNIPLAKFIINIENVGNTSAASIPVAISQAIESEDLKTGEIILLTAAGVGFTYGSAILTL